MSETDPDLRAAVAKELGYYTKQTDGKWPRTYIHRPDGRRVNDCPRFDTDLNAAAEMRKALTESERESFVRFLWDDIVCNRNLERGCAYEVDVAKILDAPADKQCRAFLKAKGAAHE